MTLSLVPVLQNETTMVNVFQNVQHIDPNIDILYIYIYMPSENIQGCTFEVTLLLALMLFFLTEYIEANSNRVWKKKHPSVSVNEWFWNITCQYLSIYLNINTLQPISVIFLTIYPPSQHHRHLICFPISWQFPYCVGKLMVSYMLSTNWCLRIRKREKNPAHRIIRILGLRPANERRCYFVTASLIGWAQT